MDATKFRARKSSRVDYVRLLARINTLTPERRAITPFPRDWELDHDSMIQLVKWGMLGMDGFKYCFKEYAQQCWRVCHR